MIMRVDPRTLFNKTFVGALVGFGLGLVQACIVPTGSRDRPVPYHHPKKQKRCTLDTLGMDKEPPFDSMALTVMLWKLHDLLAVDVTVSSSANRQYNVICHRFQRFFLVWNRMRELVEDPRARSSLLLRLRRCGTELLQSIAHMEKHIWNAREIEEIMRAVSALHEFVTRVLAQNEKDAALRNIRQ